MFVSVILTVISALFIIYTYKSLGIGDALGFFGDNSALYLGAISAVVMLFGIVFGSLYQRISKNKRKISITKELTATFSSPHFWSTLCVAPLVFFATYSLTSEDPMKLSSIALSFQNGFFCQAIFKEMFSKRLEGKPAIDS